MHDFYQIASKKMMHHWQSLLQSISLVAVHNIWGDVMSKVNEQSRILHGKFSI